MGCPARLPPGGMMLSNWTGCCLVTVKVPQHGMVSQEVKAQRARMGHHAGSCEGSKSVSLWRVEVA
jgi:hypothetical protein